MKLLLTGDLHLGRSSTRLPREKRDLGRAISGWSRLVAFAIKEQVSAVVLSGDVLDEHNSFWEAAGPFQSGIERLAARGIRTLAVAGNHDADVLPRLANTLPPEAFTLIGADGEWQRITLEENGTPALHLDGWSFPTKSVPYDPTRSYPGNKSDTLPVLAVVHGDPGASESSYAPLSLSRLQSLPVDGWLLGHIHKPSLTPGIPWVLMPGSPHPLDPGEPDLHSAWIIETRNGTLTEPRPCCPAALQYRSIDILLRPDDPLTVDVLQSRIREHIQQADTDAFQVLRIRFTGQHSAIGDLEDITRTLTEWEDPNACIDRVTLEVLPALDLDALRGSGPVPAKLADALTRIPPDLQTRLEDVCKTLSHQKEFSAQNLPDFSPEDLPLRSLLERSLRAALEATE